MQEQWLYLTAATVFNIHTLVSYPRLLINYYTTRVKQLVGVVKRCQVFGPSTSFCLMDTLIEMSILVILQIFLYWPAHA